MQFSYSVLSYAVYLVSVNRPRLKHTDTLKITLYVLLFGLTLFAVRLCSGTELQLPTHWYMWGNLLALAIFPTAISFFCTNKAIQYIGSTPTAILGSLEPVTAIFFGITVFGETVTIRETIGLTLIIMAVTAVVAGNDMATIIVRIRKLLKKIITKPYLRKTAFVFHMKIH